MDFPGTLVRQVNQRPCARVKRKTDGVAHIYIFMYVYLRGGALRNSGEKWRVVKHHTKRLLRAAMT